MRKLGLNVVFIFFVLNSLGNPLRSSERRWATPSAGLNCTGAPMVPCDGDGGGYSVGGAATCDSVGEESLVRGDLDKANLYLGGALKKAIKKNDRIWQISCLNLLGLTAQREALKFPGKKGYYLSIALKRYKDIIVIQPEHMEALQAILAIYEERGDKDLAEETRRIIQKLQGSSDHGGAAACTRQEKGAILKIAQGALLPNFSMLASTPQSVKGLTCQSYNLDPVPTWTFSATLTASGSLLLMDSLKNRILSYNLYRKGPYEEISALPISCCSPPALAYAPTLSSNGDILQYRDSLLLLRNYDAPAWLFDITSEAKNKTGSVTSLVSWTVAGNHLVGFGDLLLPNGVYKSGLFEIPFADPSTYNIISSMTLADPRRVFYWGGFPYLASIGNEAYFLEMGPVPTVYKFKPGEDDKHMTLVYKLPNDLRHPGLPRASDSLSKFFHATEKAVMPIGLYSTDNFLFILARRPQGSSTIWELLKIDPKQGRLVSRRPLPIHPKHLLVIPGEQFWGFLAKGDISESGHQIRQETGSLMLVPRQILESDMPFCSAPEFIAKASVHISPGAH